MSLINEALKRTRDASYQAAPPRPTGSEPYRVSPTVSQNRQRTKPIIWVMFGVMTLAVIAVTFIFARVNKTSQTVAETFQAPPPVAAPAPVVSQPTPEVEARLVEKAVAQLKAEQAATPPLPVPPPPPPVPEPPKFTLQGITVDSSGREAMINGATLIVGDVIEGARVTAIESRVVKLELLGKEILLRLP